VTTSLLPTITAKSDQLNAEDLIGGPRTVRVTDVKVTASDDQPVWISFEGDQGKPFKPCKTVRRLLVRVWGDDGSVYAGRSMTLYLDPEVKYGGQKVGGIRVSHVSHIDSPMKFFLTETRGKKREISVRPLASDTGGYDRGDRAEELRDKMLAGVRQIGPSIVDDRRFAADMADLKDMSREYAAQIEAELETARSAA
jgi:hypothetical protein